MWSHYANNHKGYCLVFRTMDGKINQCPLRIKKSVSFLTPKSFSPRMTFPIEPGFRVEDMVYRESQERLNAFMGFPVAVNANKYTPEEVKRYQNESSGVYTKKHTVWEYEKEARIVLSSGISWLAGERLALSPHQRLLHYDSTQLIGLVFGAKMPESQRNRIREIVSEKVRGWYDGSGRDRIISDFMIFEEKLSEMNREVKAEPLEIHSCDKVTTKQEEGFINKYEAWKAGNSIHFRGSSAERIVVK